MSKATSMTGWANTVLSQHKLAARRRCVAARNVPSRPDWHGPTRRSSSQEQVGSWP